MNDTEAKKEIGAIPALEKLRELEVAVAAAFKAGEDDAADGMMEIAERLYSGFPGGRPHILDLARERLEQMGAV